MGSYGDLHTGHPILRRRDREGSGRPYLNYVRIGVWRDPDHDDEVWTRSSKLLRDLSDHLEGMWGDTSYWRIKRTTRPWCYRNVAERFISEIILPYAEWIRCTIIEDRDANFTSQYAERIFDLFRIDGVVRHPAPSEVKGMFDENGRPLEHQKQYNALFKIVPEELENWVSVRRILLSDNPRIADA